jgi:hypothetical protein
MTACLIPDWTSDDFHSLEKGVLLARHRLAETGLFEDENLIRIFDTQPAEHLSVNTMGVDTNKFEWREGDRNGVSSEVLLDTLKTGHLWVNCRNMLDHQPEYAKLINSIYDDLEKYSPGFKAVDRSANLLISAPTVLVHYHVDIPVNMLWHIRGRKRVWVYPHFDHRFVSQRVMELVCAGEFSEDVPYDPEFDNYALVFDVEPGQLLTWPQHTPHRVTNLAGLNVSLSTEHKNARAVRRINCHLANRFLRNKLGRYCHSVTSDGPAAHVKQVIARSVRLCQKLTQKQQAQYTYPISFKVDPSAPSGVALLDVDESILVAPHENEELVVGN